MRSDPGSIVPIVFAPQAPFTYWVKYMAGNVRSTVKVTGMPRFEYGDLIFNDGGKWVRAFARGVWLEVGIVEDE